MRIGGSVSKVEMATPMALISKMLFPSISTFETPPLLTWSMSAGLAATAMYHWGFVECHGTRYGSPALGPNAIVHGIAGIDDDLVVFCKAGFDHGFHRITSA